MLLKIMTYIEFKEKNTKKQKSLVITAGTETKRLPSLITLSSVPSVTSPVVQCGN